MARTLKLLFFVVLCSASTAQAETPPVDKAAQAEANVRLRDAVIAGDVSAVRKALSEGTDPNQDWRIGYGLATNPLIDALLRNRVALARELFVAGARLDAYVLNQVRIDALLWPTGPSVELRCVALSNAPFLTKIRRKTGPTLEVSQLYAMASAYNCAHVLEKLDVRQAVPSVTWARKQIQGRLLSLHEAPRARLPALIKLVDQLAQANSQLLDDADLSLAIVTRFAAIERRQDSKRHVHDLLRSTISQLGARGLMLSARDGDGQTLLHKASVLHAVHTSLGLIDAGADPRAIDGSGGTILDAYFRGLNVLDLHSTEKERRQHLADLVRAGADPNHVDASGEALLRRIDAKHVALLVPLVRDANARDALGQSAMSRALDDCDLDKADALVSAGLKITRDDVEMSPLRRCPAPSESSSVVRELQRVGLDPNGQPIPPRPRDPILADLVDPMERALPAFGALMAVVLIAAGVASRRRGLHAAHRLLELGFGAAGACAAAYWLVIPLRQTREIPSFFVIGTCVLFVVSFLSAIKLWTLVGMQWQRATYAALLGAAFGVRIAELIFLTTPVGPGAEYIAIFFIIAFFGAPLIAGHLMMICVGLLATIVHLLRPTSPSAAALPTSSEGPGKAIGPRT